MLLEVDLYASLAVIWCMRWGMIDTHMGTPWRNPILLPRYVTRFSHGIVLINFHIPEDSRLLIMFLLYFLLHCVFFRYFLL
jgi:hypothetical protein